MAPTWQVFKVMIPTRFLIEKRIVTLPEDATVTQAGKLMCSLAIGCVLVTNSGGSLVGIVTDRDLACIAVGQKGRADIPVNEIMTTRPLTVEQSEDLEHVVFLMEESGIRRIPVIERLPNGDQKCVGLITLDDLIASKLVDYDQASRVIRSQIERRHALRFPASTENSRRIAGTPHLPPSLNNFYQRIQERTGLSGDQLTELTQTVLAAIVQRLHYSGAVHFISLLPKGLQNQLLSLPPGPDQRITATNLKEEISSRYHFSQNDTGVILKQFFHGLSELLPPSETEYLRSYLPDELAQLLPQIDSTQRIPNEAA